MQNAPLESGCEGFGLMLSMAPSRSVTREPQCTEHSVQVVGMTFTLPPDKGALDFVIRCHRAGSGIRHIALSRAVTIARESAQSRNWARTRCDVTP